MDIDEEIHEANSYHSGRGALDENDALVEQLLKPVLAVPSRVPRNARIAEALERAIREGVLPPGTVFPPEPELARRLGISRQPLNEALVELARRGLVTRKRRVGTVVSAPTVEQPLDRLYSFMELLGADGGGHVENHLDSIRLVRDAAAGALLAGDAGVDVFELSRRYLVGNQPFAIEQLWLPREYGKILPAARLASGVVYDLLLEFCGIAVTHADESLRLTELGRTDAARLGRPAGTPAFLIERTAFAGAAPVEIRRTIVRGERVRFNVRLPGIQTPHVE